MLLTNRSADTLVTQDVRCIFWLPIDSKEIYLRWNEEKIGLEFPNVPDKEIKYQETVDAFGTAFEFKELLALPPKESVVAVGQLSFVTPPRPTLGSQKASPNDTAPSNFWISAINENNDQRAGFATLRPTELAALDIVSFLETSYHNEFMEEEILELIDMVKARRSENEQNIQNSDALNSSN